MIYDHQMIIKFKPSCAAVKLSFWYDWRLMLAHHSKSCYIDSRGVVRVDLVTNYLSSLCQYYFDQHPAQFEGAEKKQD